MGTRAHFHKEKEPSITQEVDFRRLSLLEGEEIEEFARMTAAHKVALRKAGATWPKPRWMTSKANG